MKSKLMDWRLILVNTNIPNASFFTIQFEDYSVLDYNKELQEDYQHRAEYESLELSNTGIAFGEWQQGELPKFIAQ